MWGFRATVCLLRYMCSILMELADRKPYILVVRSLAYRGQITVLHRDGNRSSFYFDQKKVSKLNGLVEAQGVGHFWTRQN